MENWLRKNKKWISFLLAMIVITIFVFTSQTTLKQTDRGTNRETEILAQNLDTPWGIAFLPDETIIFTERSGRVSLVKNGQQVVVGNIEVSEKSESGLLGVAVDPAFNENQFIYLYYTYNEGNRVSRFTLQGTLKDEVILLDNIPNARFHDGGRIKFGPDKKLYVTTGDATNPSSAQDVQAMTGKILRMNNDGSIPLDNPFENYIYSYGHRNPQGIAWHPVTKELYAAEHGPRRNDEINLITKGGNYGWPMECTEESDEYIAPLRCYTEFTLAPAAIAFNNNELYIAGLRGTQLRKITFAEDHTTIVKEEELFSNLGRMREVVVHKGYLYLSTSNRDGRGIPRSGDDKIMRVKLG